MKFISLTAAMVVGLVALTADSVTAAEVRVLSIPFKGPLDQIAPRFERVTGHKLVADFAPSEPLRKRIDSGEQFDVVLTFPNLVDHAIRQGRVVPNTRVDIARAGLGLATRSGAGKPELRSTDAFKRVLLTASSIAYAAQGPSGVHLASVLDRLGIAQDVKSKLRPMAAGSLVAGPVARGEAEIGIVSIPFILAEPGVELAGPLPQELQDYVYYSSGIGTAAQNINAARAFVGYFTQPTAIDVLKSQGLEPSRISSLERQ